MKNIAVLTAAVMILMAVIGGTIIFKPAPGPMPTASWPMIEITSPAFEAKGLIPKKYTCDGENVNPPLSLKAVPLQAKTLVLIVDDPGAPAGIWSHWLVWNIGAKTTEIKENSLPPEAVLGMNDFKEKGYGGPCPPFGTHRYFFKTFALDRALDLPEGASRQELEKAVEGHVLGQGELMGKYGRP